jgi:hypothetical protein
MIEKCSMYSSGPNFADLKRYYHRNPGWGSVRTFFVEHKTQDRDIDFCFRSAMAVGDLEGGMIAISLKGIPKRERKSYAKTIATQLREHK